MANRTLGRPYKRASSSANGNAGNSVLDDGANGGSEGTEPDGAIGIENINREFDEHGQHDESDIGDSCSISDAVISPEQFADRARESAAGTDSSRTRKQRSDAGNKRGTRGAKKASASIEPFLIFTHNMAATVLKTPELALDEKEAKSLSDAYATFCEYHDVPVMSPKRISEINLITVVLMVYGSRFLAVQQRRKEERAAKKAKPAQVISHNFGQPTNVS